MFIWGPDYFFKTDLKIFYLSFTGVDKFDSPISARLDYVLPMQRDELLHDCW